MKSISERHKREPVKFSLDRFLIGALCFVVLVGITVVGLMAPALDKFDKWTSSPENQVKLLAITIIGGIVLYIYWVYRRFKNL